MSEALHHAQPQSQPQSTSDSRILMDLGWEGYLALQTWRGDRGLPRLTYQDGVLELMSPSLDHERIATMLGRLLETWAEETGTPLNGFGSWTLKDHGRRRGVEPDKCYALGQARPEVPDLAIEVIWTHGGLDKLDIYAGLGVPEVWTWRSGQLTVHSLQDGTYHQVAESVLLPGVPVARIQALCTRTDQTAAVRELRASLR